MLGSYAIAGDIPTGTISVSKAVLMEGEKPELSWSIEYPSTELPFEPETGEVTSKVQVDISVIGIGITDGTNEYPSTTEMKFSSDSSWTTIFNGSGSDVVTSDILVSKTLEEGTTIQFRSKVNDIVTKSKKGKTSTTSYPYYYNNSSNVTILVDGSDVPGIEAGHSDQASVADFLAPYISSETGKITLGPKDVIYAAELTHSDSSSSGFDMQDTLILVRFTDVE